MPICELCADIKKALLERAVKAEAEVDYLKELLKPFATYGALVALPPSTDPDDLYVAVHTNSKEGNTAITLGDCRRARDALGAKEVEI